MKSSRLKQFFEKNNKMDELPARTDEEKQTSGITNERVGITKISLKG